jgi:hypothetical protein
MKTSELTEAFHDVELLLNEVFERLQFIQTRMKAAGCAQVPVVADLNPVVRRYQRVADILTKQLLLTQRHATRHESLERLGRKTQAK